MSALYVSLKTPISPPSCLRRPFNLNREPSVCRINGRRAPTTCVSVGVEAPGKVGKLGLSESKEVMEAEAQVLVGTYARTPVVLASGKGCKLYDVEGREYLDLTSGIAVNALGHGDEDWLKAVIEQANTLTHVSNIYYSKPQVWPLIHATIFSVTTFLFDCRESEGGEKALIFYFV